MAIIVAGIAYGNHYYDTQRKSSAPTGQVEPAVPNRFTIMAMASELTENEPFALKDLDAYPYVSISQNSNMHGKIGYVIQVPFICEGDNIDTVTYQVDGGTFQFLGNQDQIEFVSQMEYDGPEISGAIIPDEMHDSYAANWFDNRSCYTEYTVDYDKQQPEDVFITVAGYGKIDSPSRIRMNHDRETRAAAYQELVGNTVITCTANYQDGTSETKKVRVTAVPVEEENEELIPVYFGFVLE